MIDFGGKMVDLLTKTNREETVPAISKRRRAGLQQPGFVTCVAARSLRWRSSLALQALDRLCSGIIISDDKGRVVEMNRAAQAMVRLEDGLAVRNGRLCAGRAFESARISKLVSAATAVAKCSVAAGRMLISRGDDRPAYVLTVAPLHPDLAIADQPHAVIVIVDPEQHSPSNADLVELFGLSPAEARLAAALMTGKRLAQIAAEFGVRVSTLRTQLRFILKKIGAKRQSDLVRIFSSAGIGSVSLATGWLNLALEALQTPLCVTGL
jgi:DNA-binding CsgD family transcriptional regulator